MYSNHLFNVSRFNVFQNPLHPQATEVLLSMEVSALRELIMQAMTYLDDLLVGDPKEYEQRVRESFRKDEIQPNEGELPGLRSLGGEIVVVNSYAFSAAVLLSYVDLVNSGANLDLLDSTQSFRISAFLVANKLHHALVSQVLFDIRTCGEDFGTKTALHQADVQALVWHWPRSFGFEKQVPGLNRLYTPATLRHRKEIDKVFVPSRELAEGSRQVPDLQFLVPSGYTAIRKVDLRNSAGGKYEPEILVAKSPWETAILVPDPLIAKLYYMAVSTEELRENNVTIFQPQTGNTRTKRTPIW